MREIASPPHYFGKDDRHLDDHDLERYYLGQIEDEQELARLEVHYLGCPRCAERAGHIEDEVDAIQIALLRWADEAGERIDPSRRRPKRASLNARLPPPGSDLTQL